MQEKTIAKGVKSSSRKANSVMYCAIKYGEAEAAAAEERGRGERLL